MLKTANTSFIAGDDDDDDEEVEVVAEGGDGGPMQVEIMSKASKDHKKKQPSKGDYFMHFLSVPWKLLFATIHHRLLGGWACFTVSILVIGMLTAVIGDLASQFGCWVGLKDAVTAISFVALGTSVPDTFASKVSAVQDKYAV
uniref:Sodium/calcium exchanger membrane region domain-containing protein n=1 Tax=Ditylenchus dipsaci TaxID=166011 RepID=A0A915DH07_9BILA